MVCNSGAAPLRRPLRRIAAALGLAFAAAAAGQTVGPALVVHGPTINGQVQGSVQVMSGQSITLNSGAVVTGDILAPGTPTVVLNGSPTYSGTVAGTGSTSPGGYQITLNSGSSLRHVITRTNPVSIPSVANPPAPSGTRSVTINQPTDSPGSFSTLKNLTLNSNVGQFSVPAGARDLTANSGSGFTLGFAGATQPSVYNFQQLTLNSSSQVILLGPVTITVGQGISDNGVIAANTNPSWLQLRISSGDFTLNSNGAFFGALLVPSGTVTINSNSRLVGSVASSNLTINSGGVLDIVAGSGSPSPSVSLTAPANGAYFGAPASISLSATAGESGGTIAKVDFFSGTTQVGESTGAPYQFVWSGVAAGAYTLTAVATDTLGVTGTSNAVAVTVVAPASVSITSPANNAVVAAGGSVTIQATATDSGGTVASVAFYANGSLLGTSTTAPYQFTWSSPASGTYTLKAVATDGHGVQTTSAPVSFVVDTPPVVSLTAPSQGSSFTLPATVTLSASASSSVGSIAKVQFFQGATSIGTVTSAPYQLSWSVPAAGSYSLTAVATDSFGLATTSGPVSITVNTHVPPTVSLTAPANGSVLPAPASVTLAANATANTGSIANVQFFQGLVLLGTVTSAPYSFAVSGLAAGTYIFTATATDSSGASTTSAAVTIAVVAPPSVAWSAPANGAVYAVGSPITLKALAASAGASIAKVDFYNGGTLLGTSTAPVPGQPGTYQLVLGSGLAAGSYSLMARATDSLGSTATTSAISVNVYAAPSVALTSPTNGATFNAPATFPLTATATSPAGSIASVAFYAGGSLLGTAASAVPGQPNTFSITPATGLASGSYSLTAVATDAHGISATSPAVAITVNPHQPPAVAITVPAANAVFAAPAVFTVSATATDVGGTVTQVAFYSGATLLGTATTPDSGQPNSFSVTLTTALAAGSYNLTAVATDSRGAVTTSAPVSITVDAPPTVALTAPTNGATFNAPASFGLTATATSPGGSIVSVAFYNGTALVGTATSPSPASQTRTPLPCPRGLARGRTA